MNLANRKKKFVTTKNTIYNQNVSTDHFIFRQDSPDEAKKANYDPRIKRHDGRLAALKKGNYLVQANVDRLQDEINSMREKSVTLQADLDSVLSELG